MSSFTWRRWADLRWVAHRFSRDSILSVLRTMVWVVPLTLLIWVYAEREQVADFSNEPVRIEAVTSDPNRIVSIKGGYESVVLDLSGPKARVRGVLDDLSNDRLRLEIDPNLIGDQRVSTRPLIERHPIFAQKGITVVRATPDWIELTVDDIIQGTIPVRAPSTVTNLEAGTEFSPSTITVRGPRSVIEAALRSDAAAIAQIANLEELKTPGKKHVQDVPLVLPEMLLGPHVTISGPSRVEATLQVRDRDDVWVMPSMPVWAGGPVGLFEEYTLTYRNALPNVRLVGPKDQLDALKAQIELGRVAGPPPLALLLVSAEDAGEGRSKKLIFENLPQGVRVHEETQRQPLEFSLTPK